MLTRRHRVVVLHHRYVQEATQVSCLRAVSIHEESDGRALAPSGRPHLTHLLQYVRKPSGCNYGKGNRLGHGVIGLDKGKNKGNTVIPVHIGKQFVSHNVFEAKNPHGNQVLIKQSSFTAYALAGIWGPRRSLTAAEVPVALVSFAERGTLAQVVFVVPLASWSCLR